MKTLFFSISVLLVISCQSQSTQALKNSNSVDSMIIETDSTIIDTVTLGISFTPQGSYNSVKNEVKRLMATRNSGEDFENYMLNKIIPHWYGTEWDFNGYTEIPNQGVIACGYFVSTTLLHVGVDLNRYHLAQQAGLLEAKSLAVVDSNYFTVHGMENLQTKMTTEYEDGLYFVGLDNHVGFLYMKNKELYFIHSNYIEDKVMAEKAIYSPAFQSNIYVVAELSTNEALLEKWRKGLTVKVHRQ